LEIRQVLRFEQIEQHDLLAYPVERKNEIPLRSPNFKEASVFQSVPPLAMRVVTQN
jgi:hypothetical protein